MPPITAETFQDTINQYKGEFDAAYSNYELCYSIFNIQGENSDSQCSNVISGKNCNQCLATSKAIIIQKISDMKNISDQIKTECDNVQIPAAKPGVTREQKDELVNVVNKYNTMRGSLVDSVELYKTYRIFIISEVVKLLVILAIIFYLLKTTKGIKSITFISAITYVILTSLNVFYIDYMSFIFSILAFFIFVVFAIMNINDISINYQNIANNTAETLSNISTEFKKDVNVL